MSIMDRATNRATELRLKTDQEEANRETAIVNKYVADFNAHPCMKGMPPATYVDKETFLEAGAKETYTRTVRVLAVDDVTIGVYGGEASPRFFLKTWCACGAPAWATASFESWRSEPFVDLVARALLRDAVCYECQVEALGKTVCRECGKAK